MPGIIGAVILAIIIYKASRNSATQKKAYKNNRQTGGRSFRNSPPRSTSSSGRKPAASKPQEDILSRSKQNVAETDPVSAPVADTLTDTVAAEPFSDENLMAAVEDLIVKGYEPKLSFERDFISEGMDLLNKYY